MFTIKTKQFTNNGTVVTKVTDLKTNKVLFIEQKGSIYGNNSVLVYDEKHFQQKVEFLTSDWRVKLRNIEEAKVIQKLSLSKLFYRYDNNILDTYFDNAIEVVFLDARYKQLNENATLNTKYVVFVDSTSTISKEETILRLHKKSEKNYEDDMVLFVNQTGNNEIKVSDNIGRLRQSLKTSAGEYNLSNILYIQNLDKDYDNLYEFFSNTDKGESEEYIQSGTSDKVKLIHV